ncbi:hypothetical protein FACS1894171_0540 [Clostridia bacterium]|nr:hypothetical protein FACS1894171_0540 [Clostridia bacterium]
MSEFIQGTDWSDLSYSEVQRQLAAYRASYVDNYIRKLGTKLSLKDE